MTDETKNESGAQTAEPVEKKKLTLTSLNKDVNQKLGQMEGQAEATDTKIISLTDKIDRMTAQADSTAEKMDLILKAINNPVSVAPRGKSAEEMLVERDQMTTFTEAAGTSDEPMIATSKFSDVGTLEFKKKAEVEAFMAEPVKVRILTTSERDAPQTFDISVNGMPQIFQRGLTYVVPRYFVEGLARAKPMTFENEEYRLPDNTQAVRYPSNRGLRYQFDVVEDRNPFGEAWLNMVLNQA